MAENSRSERWTVKEILKNGTPVYWINYLHGPILRFWGELGQRRQN